MEYTAFANSDIGLKYKTNQDSIVVRTADTPYGGAIMAVICDGMGGLEQGELASATAALGFAEWFEYRFKYFYYICEEKWLRNEWQQLINRLNEAVEAYGRKNNKKLGTTITGVLIYRGQHYIINIGDSRTYGLIDGQFSQMSNDHSFVAERIAAGEMSASEAAVHPKRHCITRCIGVKPEVEADIYVCENYKPSVWLMCSDGFYGRCLPSELERLIRAAAAGSKKKINILIQKIFEANKNRGEKDNMSVVVVTEKRGSFFGSAAKKMGTDRKTNFKISNQINYISSERYIPLNIRNNNRIS